MKYIRAAKRSHFVSVSSQMVRDPRIGAVAKAVVLYRADQADGYRLTNEELCRALRIGREQLATALRELTAAGYYTIEKVRNEHGQIVTERTLREESLTAPATGQQKAAAAIEDPFRGVDRMSARQRGRHRRAG